MKNTFRTKYRFSLARNFYPSARLVVLFASLLLLSSASLTAIGSEKEATQLAAGKQTNWLIAQAGENSAKAESADESSGVAATEPPLVTFNGEFYRFDFKDLDFIDNVTPEKIGVEKLNNSDFYSAPRSINYLRGNSVAHDLIGDIIETQNLLYRFDIANDSNEQRFLLAVPFYWYNSLKFFLSGEGCTGLSEKLKQLPVSTEFRFPIIYLDIPLGKKCSLHVFSRINFVFENNFFVSGEKFFLKAQMKKGRQYSIIYGVLITLIIVTGITSFFGMRPLLIRYFLLVLSFFFYAMVMTGDLKPSRDYEHLQNNIESFFALAPIWTAVLFVFYQYLIKISFKKFPISSIIFYITLTLVLSFATLILIFGMSNTLPLILMWQSSIIVLFVAIIYHILRLSLQKKLIGFMLLSSFLPFTILLAISALDQVITADLNPFNDFTPGDRGYSIDSILWGMTFTIFFLSFTLVEQYRQTRREREEAKAEALNNLERANRVKDEFLANTSHELKTPLQAIIGLSEKGMQHCQENPQLLSDLGAVRQSAQRLSALINDLLDFSQMKASTIELYRTGVNLQSLLEHMQRLNAPLAAEKSLALKLEAANDLPAIYADENRLAQILQNLISNAIKYTSAGEIILRAERSLEKIIISVSDSGRGISPDKLESIFEPFERGDAESARSAPGTGIGLSVTKQLVELHDSELRVNSTMGSGSTFSFALPVYSGEITEKREYAKTIPATTEPATFVSHLNPGAKYLIYAVDDEPMNRRVLAAQLEQSAYEVLLLETAEELLQKVSEKVPHLILLDVMLPGMSGFEATVKLRENHPATQLPILLLTAKTRNEDLAQGMNAGANDYLPKPYEREELLMRVENLLRFAELSDLHESQLAEREKVFFEEKEKIFADLHDHIGSRLTDLQVLIARLSRVHDFPLPLLDEADRGLQEVSRFLREKLHGIDDILKLNEDFLPAVHAVLLRRYNNVARKFTFDYDEAARDWFNERANEKIRRAMLSVLEEVTTNDLKYGRVAESHSSWNITRTNHQTTLTFSAPTSYVLAQRHTGNGTGNIARRVRALAGEIEHGIDEEVYRLAVRFG